VSRKRFTPEQIVTTLREIGVPTARDKDIGLACKTAGASDKSYYCWRKASGGLKSDQVRRSKELEQENARLKRVVAELSPEKVALAELA